MAKWLLGNTSYVGFKWDKGGPKETLYLPKTADEILDLPSEENLTSLELFSRLGGYVISLGAKSLIGRFDGADRTDRALVAAYIMQSATEYVGGALIDLLGSQQKSPSKMGSLVIQKIKKLTAVARPNEFFIDREAFEAIGPLFTRDLRVQKASGKMLHRTKVPGLPEQELVSVDTSSLSSLSDDEVSQVAQATANWRLAAGRRQMSHDIGSEYRSSAFRSALEYKSGDCGSGESAGGASGGGDARGGGGDDSNPPKVWDGEPQKRYLEADFAPVIRLGQRMTIRARFVESKGEKPQAEMKMTIPPDGAEVWLHLDAGPNLKCLDDVVKKCHVPPRGASDDVEFPLVSIGNGVCTVCIRAILQANVLGELRLEITVDDKIEEEPVRSVKHDIPDQKINPQEVTLLITYTAVNSDDIGEYRYYFFEGPRAPVVCDEGGPLKRPRSDIVNGAVTKLNEITKGKVSKIVASHTLQRIGEELWEELVPASLADVLLNRPITSLIIQSDGDPMLWELLHPPERLGKHDWFLSEHVLIGRTGRSNRSLSIELHDAKFVKAEGKDLRSVKSELDAIRELLHRPLDGNVIDTLEEMIETLKGGNFQHLHFACHNSFNSEGDYITRISFLDGDLLPLHVPAGPFATTPLVFMNACRSGATAFHHVGLSGWATRFMDAGAAAFIGTLWEVRDDTARRFAEAFYRALMKVETVGDAVQQARNEIKAPGDPSHLAYTLFGYPSTSVQFI